MDECAGEWKSTTKWIKRHGKEPPVPPVDPDDGDIHIEHDHTKNKHRAKNGKEHPLTEFNCTPDAGDPKKFTITFRRKEPLPGSPVEETIVYKGNGVISDDGARITGTVRVPGGPEPGDNGTWESTRAGGGPFDDKDERGDWKGKRGHDD